MSKITLRQRKTSFDISLKPTQISPIDQSYCPNTICTKVLCCPTYYPPKHRKVLMRTI